MQFFVIAVGLALAGWGHLLVHDLLGTQAAWRAVDDLFPAQMRTSAALAGRLLLAMGALAVVVSVLA